MKCATCGRNGPGTPSDFNGWRMDMAGQTFCPSCGVQITADDEDTGCAACGHDLDIDVDIIDDAKRVGKDGRLSGIHRRCT